MKIEKPPKWTGSKGYVQGHPAGPRGPFRLFVCGSSGCGKTNLIHHLISKKIILGSHYTLIVDNEDQGAYESLARLPSGVLCVRKKDQIPSLDQIHGAQPIVVFDDMALARGADLSKIKDFFANGRSRGISSVFVTQSMTDVDSLVLCNCTHMALFSFGDEYKDDVQRRRAGVSRAVWSEATRDGGFLWVDKQDGIRYFRNVDEEILFK